ncbi:1-acyl-sn-glycerol-3-phosphate acyltransferase [Cylindrospermum stagnale PCC 7417]|uniref:1-acyl-sn-glycerol-3-phosphate acyltransferase n=1 Tax=Cylindrospermum stagnale PCC 7417 TaxID=56107 RepID=K9X2Z5_9NOST|nr:1-acyl-sn-glycerol-3-phosphate acyltransferase [Cylindrospermum stagnale]AFZ27015.1 1-acyl-sn-glycerol-3-phosphate acyltransferase [Cylindrospermum stagnale PCC 7417]
MMELYSASTTCQASPTDLPANAQVASTTSQVSPWLSPLLYLLGRHIVLPFFFRRIKITGQENIPKSGPVIFAPTHRARWDSLLLPYAAGRGVTGRDLRFMVTITECQGLQGWFVRRMGGFPVDPQHPAITTLRHSVELLLDQEMLVIFPEGGIYRDGAVHPLKPGIARLALSAELTHPGLGVKIVPVGINYSQPFPSWGADASVHIGEALIAKDYMNGCVKRDAKRLTADLANMLLSLSRQESAIANHAFAEIPNS